MATKNVLAGRHAKAVKAFEKGRNADIIRDLSDEGRRQAEERRGDLPPHFVFDRVAASCALRTQRTAHLITGMPVRNITIIKELYTPETKDGDLLERLGAELDNVPVYKYLEHPLNRETGCVERLAKSGAAALNAFIDQVPGDELLSITGHAVYTPLFLGELSGDDRMRDWFYKSTMDECGIFRLTFVNGAIRHYGVF